MSTVASLDQARTYLDVQLTRPAEPGGRHRHPSGPFITLSREAGAGSSEFARELLAILNLGRGADEEIWTLFDRNLVESLLGDLNLSPQLARFLPEDAVPELEASVGEMTGLHPNLWQLTRRSNGMMRELARRGHAIIVGRGANFVTTGLPNGCHIRLCAPLEQRVERLQRLYHLNSEAAAAYAHRTDRARRDYVRATFDADVADASAYDLVLNTARILPPAGAALVAAVLHPGAAGPRLARQEA